MNETRILVAEDDATTREMISGVLKKHGSRLVGVDYELIVAEAERSRESLLNQFGLSLEDVRFDRGLDLEPDSSDEHVAAVAKSSGH